MLLLGTEEIIVQLLPADTPDSALDEIALLTDFHKTSLTTVERANVAKKLMDSTKASGKELAARLRIDPGYLIRLLSLFKCPEPVQQAAREGKLGPGDWYAISQSPDPLCTLDLKLGNPKMTRDELAEAVKAAKKGRETATPDDSVKMERLPVALNSGIVLIKAKKGEEPLNLTAARTLLVDALARVDAAIKDGFSIKTAARAFEETKNKPPRRRKRRESA